MNLEDSYRILGIGASSSEEERFRAYQELRERLDAKLSNAPTPGLKEKYAKTLLQLDEAIEIAESSFDEKEMPIFGLGTPEPERHSENGDQVPSVPVGSAESPKRSGPFWLVLGGLIIVALLLVSSLAWRRHTENEEQRVAAIELARAEEVRNAELAAAKHEIKPLIEPYELFSKKLESTLEKAIARGSELEIAKGVAEREGSQEEQEISTYRLEKYTEYIGWLREYLEDYRVVDTLEAVEKLVDEGKVDEAKDALEGPLPNFEKLLATIEKSNQKYYELPIKEFLANQEFDRALEISKNALSRQDFETAIAALKPYGSREYVKEKAKLELESLYGLKHQDFFKKAQHAADIGEFQLARSLLDAVEDDPVSSAQKQKQIDLVARLNSEYALEEAFLASRRALERNEYAQAREQLSYLLDDPHVGERAKESLEKVESLESAWQWEQDAIRREAELAKLEENALEEADERLASPDFDSPPQLLSKVDPVYPDLLRRNGVSGYVELEWVIGVDGRAKSIDVLSSSRYEYEIPAVEAVKRWRFKPAEKDGVSVTAKVRQKLLFNPN